MVLNNRSPIQLFSIVIVAVILTACGGGDKGPGTTGTNDTNKPTVISTSPTTDVDAAAITEIIKVTFSEAIAPVQTDNITITPVSASGAPGTPLNFPEKDVLVLTDKDTVLNVRLANAGTGLVANTQYLVKVDGIQDYAGNVMAGSCQWLFATTGATLTKTTTGPCMTVPGIIGFEVMASTIDENSTAGTATLLVTRTGGSDGIVSVDYATSDVNANSAIAGSDYRKSNGTLQFSDGDDSSQTITIPIINDTTTENSELFAVSLSNISGGATLGSSRHMVTIDDDEIPPQGSLSFSFTTSSVKENIPSGTVAVYVTRTGGSTGSVSVDYATRDGSVGSNNPATAGKDYTASSASLTFAPGITMQSFVIPIINDTDPEKAETFSVSLSNVTGGATLRSPGDHTVTIIDDEILIEPIVLTVTAVLKQLQFSWTQSTQVASYNLYVNPDGRSGFTQVVSAGITGTTYNLDIAAHTLDWVYAKYLVEACIKTICTISNEITVTDQMLNSIGYIKANNMGAGENFGTSVALSDDGLVMAVGAPRESSDQSGAKNTAIDSGAVYLFSRDTVTTNWTQTAFIKAGNAEAGDLFGASVALSSDGKTLAVGAANEDSDQSTVFNPGNFPTNNNAAIDAGAVYIFTRDTSGAWNQQAYIKASNTGAGDNFGFAVSLSNDGNSLAVGAFNEDSLIAGIINDSVNFPKPDLTETATIDAGAVYVFSRVTTNWVQQSYLKGNNQTISGNNPKAQDYFGYSVALSGNGSSLVVGAYGIDDSRGIDSGGAFLFTHDGKGVWSQQQYTNPYASRLNDYFGWSVTISDNGNVMAIGAKAANSIGGGVYIYTINSTGAWETIGRINAQNPKAGDNFGGSVSISGDGRTLVIGASAEEGNSKGINKAFNNFAANAGAVYLYISLPEPGNPNLFFWIYKSYIKASNTDIDDLFGSAVALSVDGSTLAVGAPGEAGAATGGTNSNITPDTQNAAAGAGAIYLY